VFVHRLKLRPPRLQPSWLARPELEIRLSEAVRVLSVVAAPGYGKTVLAARLHDAWPGPKLWYGLDSSDADLAVFAAHLDELSRSDGALAPFAADAWRLGTPKDVGSLFAESIAEVAGSVLIVFDDVHALRKSRAQDALQEMLERAVRLGATFVLSGRSMPLSLHAFAASGELATLTSADLAFAPSEATAYLERECGSAGSGREAAELLRRADGWPAGLALIAHSVARPTTKGTLRPAVSAEETRRLLFDYLAKEALADLTVAERDLMLRTSILERLEPEVCDAVLEGGGSRTLLQGLARRGLFVARNADDAFTCHELFREFLLEQLDSTHARSSIATLRIRAAAELNRRGEPAAAIEQLLAAGALDEAAAMLDGCALRLLRLGMPATVGRLVRNLPQQTIASRPALLMAQGRDLRERGEWDAALGALERAIQAGRHAQAYDVLAESVRIAAQILASRGEFEQVRALLEDALSLEDRLPKEGVTTLRMTLAAVNIETQRYDEALAIFRDITPAVIERGDEAVQGQLLHNTAVAHLRRGDLYAGLALYERALKLKRGSGQRVSSLPTLGDIVYTRMLLGDLDEAATLCDELLASARDYGGNAAVAHALERRGTLHLLRGDVAFAEQAFHDAAALCDPDDVLVMPDIQHGLSQCALARGAIDDADALSSTAAAVYRRTGKLQQMAPILLTRARVEAKRGAPAAAYRTATEAVDACTQGDDAVLEVSTALSAAALIVELLPALEGEARAAADARAAQAAGAAVARLHERDYRFLLRTQAATLQALREHLHRWGVGPGLWQERGPGMGRTLRIDTLGGFQVIVEGRALDGAVWKRRRARDIFAYLVNARGRAVTRAKLADLYWSELDADAANDNLRVTISAIRKAAGNVVRFETDGYRFDPPPGTVIDRDLFDGRIERAREHAARGDAAAARRLYESAAGLYNGDYLEGMDDGGWQWHERERLRAACLEALRAVAADPDLDIARLALERLLEVAPFDFEAVRLHLDRLVREQRTSDALRDYSEWCSRYRATVGSDPPAVWEPPVGAV
jgi:ATP/maltotriose-dependent transcriptional regulator MalT/DNA-binding SARP family transcriptional activator